MLEYELRINNNPERIVYLRIFAAKSFSIRTDIIRNFQIKTQERRNKMIKRNRDRSKKIENMENI
jgi:hypothetical protein